MGSTGPGIDRGAWVAAVPAVGSVPAFSRLAASTRTWTLSRSASIHAADATVSLACARVYGLASQSSIKCVRHIWQGITTLMDAMNATRWAWVSGDASAWACNAATRMQYHRCSDHSGMGGALDDGIAGCLCLLVFMIEFYKCSLRFFPQAPCPHRPRVNRPRVRTGEGPLKHHVIVTRCSVCTTPNAYSNYHLWGACCGCVIM